MKGICELDEVVNAPEKENLMIVDGLNFAFRYKHRGQTDFAAEYLRTLHSLAKSYGAKEVIVLNDWKHSSFRREIDEGYKQNRKERYENQTEEEKEKALAFFEAFEKAMELIKTQFPILKFKFVEADDIAGYLVKRLKNNFKHVWLISSDGDWDLLLSEKVSRFSFVTRREYTLDNFYDNHGCDTPEEFVSMKVLQGDSGDNIIGLEGVGAKRAYNLIREYGTALDIYCFIPLAGKQKFVERINNSGDLIPRNYQLVDLLSYCEEAINHPDNNNMVELEEFCKKYD